MMSKKMNGVYPPAGTNDMRSSLRDERIIVGYRYFLSHFMKPHTVPSLITNKTTHHSIEKNQNLITKLRRF